ncbi:unnamed protein product [Heterobilharzia americana]|nr:unnamed protein product [Heterobilharzia americana]
MLSTSHTARLFLCTYLPVHFTSALIYMAFINPHERITMPRELVDNSNDLILFNFTDSETTSLDRWVEVSDTVREAGRSKAALVSHVAYNYQSAIFFYLLNPLPDGACFADEENNENQQSRISYTFTLNGKLNRFVQVRCECKLLVNMEESRSCRECYELNKLDDIVYVCALKIGE